MRFVLARFRCTSIIMSKVTFFGCVLQGPRGFPGPIGDPGMDGTPGANVCY